MLLSWEGDETRLEMRWTLFNWIFDIAAKDALNLEPACIPCCYHIIDRFIQLRAPAVRKDTLQLIGATALFIAAKLFHRATPNTDYFIEYGNGMFGHSEIIDMEKQMLTTTGFDLFQPYDRFKLESHCNRLAYTLDLCLLDTKFIGVPTSVLKDAWQELEDGIKGVYTHDLLTMLRKECDRIGGSVRRKYTRHLEALDKWVGELVRRERRTVMTRSQSKGLQLERASWLQTEERPNRKRGREPTEEEFQPQKRKCQGFTRRRLPCKFAAQCGKQFCKIHARTNGVA